VKIYKIEKTIEEIKSININYENTINKLLDDISTSINLLKNEKY
jgi:hypothetical protein